jgi:hypothetical protein
VRHSTFLPLVEDDFWRANNTRLVVNESDVHYCSY